MISDTSAPVRLMNKITWLKAMALSILSCATVAQAQQAPLEPFAVGSHWNESKQYTIAKDAGVQWLRIDINWYHIQPTGPDEWLWAPIDAAVEEAKRLDMKILAIMSYSTPWSSSAPKDDNNAKAYAHREEFDERYQAQIRAIVERYKGRIDAWEVMNEPDHYNFLKIGEGCWAANHFPAANNDEQRRRQYLHHIELAQKAIEPFRKEITLTTSGFATGGRYDAEFLNWLASQEGFFKRYDVLNFHRYGYPKQDDLIEGINIFRTLQKDQSLQLPVWVTEHGITRHTADAPPADSARFLVRSYAVALSNGVDKLFWFRFAPGGDHVTMLKDDGSPSVIHPAYKTMTTHWNAPIRVTPLGTTVPGVHGAIADRQDGQRVAIVWADEPVTIESLSLKVTKAFDLNGAAIQLEPEAEISADPAYLYLEK